jgi:hypothetical protein
VTLTAGQQNALQKIGSTGRALLHTEFRIVNEERGDCEPDELDTANAIDPAASRCSSRVGPAGSLLPSRQKGAV